MSVENDNENKKPSKEQSKMKSSMNSVSFHGGIPRKVPTQEATRKVRSPKQPKKRVSRDQLSISEDVSEGMDTIGNEEDNNNTSVSMTLTTQDLNLNLTDTPPAPKPKIQTPPPTHFSPVLVEIPEDLRDTVFNFLTDRKSLNRNMVVTLVPRELMSLFMSGDQICKVSGFPVWNPEDVTTAFSKSYQTTVTVIRVWNLKCPSRDQLTKVGAEPGRHFFVVTAYSDEKENIGMSLASRKKQIVVNRIFAKTPMSTALLVGDQLLMIGNQSLVEGGKRIKKKHIVMWIKQYLKSDGFVEIMACRSLGARTSPAPSLEAEQVRTYPQFGAEGGELNLRVKKKKFHNQLDLPLPADSLEIAFRELTFLRELGFPDSDEFSPNRGPSLFDPPISTPDGSAKSITASPVSPSTPVSRTPANQNSSWKSIAVREPNSTIQFNEGNLTESSNITSDVLEEENLKKCDGKSGMVAYIKAKFNPKVPMKK